MIETLRTIDGTQLGSLSGTYWSNPARQAATLAEWVKSMIGEGASPDTYRQAVADARAEVLYLSGTGSNPEQIAQAVEMSPDLVTAILATAPLEKP
jgi:hypothetical protein